MLHADVFSRICMCVCVCPIWAVAFECRDVQTLFYGKHVHLDIF